MSLTWGRTPDAEQLHALRWPRSLLIAAVLAALISSTTDPFLTRSRSIIEQDTQERIQAVLDAHQAAVERGDLFAYERTLDRRSFAFVRCMRDLFELGPIRSAALEPHQVLKMEQTGPGDLVRIQVQQRDGVAMQYMRRLESVRLLTQPPFDIRSSFTVWYISQPDASEIGGSLTKRFGAIDLTYWQIDDHVSDLFGREIAAARDFAAAHSPIPLEAELRARLVATRDLASASTTCLASGRYEHGNREILVFRYWLDPSGGLSASTREMLRHEALHWVQWQVAPNMRRVDWWLREGWPEYVIGSTRNSEVLREHACGSTSQLPSVSELQKGPGIESEVGPRAFLLYGAAQSAVEYLFQVHGGSAAYWDLVRRSSEGRPSEAYSSALGLSIDKFHDRWAEWLRTTMRC